MGAIGLIHHPGSRKNDPSNIKPVQTEFVF
jgi:hypothetical protein